MHLRDHAIKLRRTGATHYEIARALDLTPAEVFSWLRKHDIEQARKLAAEGLSERGIAEELRVSRSLVRKWIKAGALNTAPNKGGRPRKEEETAWVKIGRAKYGPHNLPMIREGREGDENV